MNQNSQVCVECEKLPKKFSTQNAKALKLSRGCDELSYPLKKANRVFRKKPKNLTGVLQIMGRMEE